MFICYSNLTELAEFSTLAEAKRFALAESDRYDDIVRIASPGRVASGCYFAQYGVLYRATATR